MDIAIKRPILIGGLGLSASLWLLDVVHHLPMDGSLILGAIALGSGAWWFHQHSQRSVVPTIPKQVTVQRDAIDQALERADQLIELLLTENSQAVAQAELYRTEHDLLLDSLERTDLKLAITGNKATGKTTLLNCLETSSASSLTFTDQSDDISDADLVLLVIAGDMTASELNRLETLVAEGYQVLVVLNKQDQYSPIDKAVVLDRINGRATERGVDVVAIAANPNPIKVRRHAETGEITEFFEQPAAELQPLTQKLNSFTTEPGPLVMATTLRQTKALQRRITQTLNEYRRQKAMPVLEQMQWIAAGTAFASPIVTIDLLAAAAINGQLVLDLGAIYGQKFSLDQAKAAAGTIAELTVKLGLVELASQALGTLLKSHVTTYLAGGALQGISAAYLTRLAGLTLIDYFEEQSLLETSELHFESLGSRLQALFQQARQGLALKDFVTQALPHLPTMRTVAS
ncbi:hypothetical protein N836_06095 [Leptolyngbya sp. Heron Island J]|uniref:slr1306 family protein n=1 Tax=Leptolyngbya sp. Heron Island J TaxID=1385935 RepID=UPI0003B997B4|nr:DUF697 domain-containing protein [Leptolyngbya sp. Heron Island J]ESA36808.1 hypothetical protein N836_06095 [Leptolyngbya sp. Heron Island J]